MTHIEYKNYDSTLELFKEQLQQYGVVVIPNVLNKDEIKNMRNGMWDMLHQLTSSFDIPINKKNHDTWKSFYDLMPMHSMLLQHFGIGHSQFIWDVRQNKNVVNVFSKLWNCKEHDLLTSFDGLSIHLPPEITKRGWYKNNDWLHTDQSYKRNDFECVQGFVSGYDINEGDATLTLLEGSHKYHKDFSNDHDLIQKSDNKEIKLSDWYKLNKSEYDYYNIEKKCKRTSVLCTSGSLVLWDSRTIHCGMEPLKTRNKKNTRLVVYVCQIPRKLSTQKQLIKKQKAFLESRMTTHNPHKIKLFPKTPRTYGKELPKISKLDKPILTELGLTLAGF